MVGYWQFAEEKNVHFPVSSLDENTVVCIESDTTDDDGESYSKVIINHKVSGELIVAEGGTYSSCAAVMYEGIIYVAFTSIINNESVIELWRVNRLKDTALLYKTDAGKISNVVLAVNDKELAIAWERLEEGNQKIQMVLVNQERDITLSLNTVIDISDSFEKAYAPQIIWCENQFYCTYESFSVGSYRICVKTIQDQEISEGLLLGPSEYNNQKVDLCVRNGRVLVAFENTKPLYKGYTWKDVVKMPGFGHGWQVETTMYMYEIDYRDNVWLQRALVHADGDTGLIFANEKGSTGCPSLTVDKRGIIYLSYLKWMKDDYGRRFQQCFMYFDGHQWVHYTRQDIGHLQRNTVKTLFEESKSSVVSSGIMFKDETQGRSEWTQNNNQLPKTVVAIKCPQILGNVNYQWKWQEIQLSDSPEVIKSHRHCIQLNNEHLNLYYGDLHMHTNLSGCSLGEAFHCIELEDKYRYSKDVASLDFAMITDHDSMHAHEWTRTKMAADIANVDEFFVAFQGVEWTCTHHKDKLNYGHYNILYKEAGPLIRTLSEEGDGIEKVWKILESKEALTIPHHPSESVHLLNWEHFNEKKERLIEIFQVRGSYESDDCLMNPSQYGRTYNKNASIRYGLELGYKFGFTSGGEHEGVGVTGVYAKNLSRASIYDALMKRCTFGTTGDKIAVHFTVNEHLMGSDIGLVKADLTLNVETVGTDIIEFIYMVIDGHEYQLSKGGAKDLSIQCIIELEQLTKGHHYCYVALKQSNDEMAWCSPVFFETK